MFLTQVKALNKGDKIYHIIHTQRIDTVKEVRIYQSMIVVKTEKGRNLFWGGSNDDINIDLDYWDLYFPIPSLIFSSRGK